jgi:hypothetical protein
VHPGVLHKNINFSFLKSKFKATKNPIGSNPFVTQITEMFQPKDLSPNEWQYKSGLYLEEMKWVTRSRFIANWCEE